MKGKSFSYAGIGLVLVLALTGCYAENSGDTEGYSNSEIALADVVSDEIEPSSPNVVAVVNDDYNMSQGPLEQNISEIQKLMKEQNKELAVAFLGYDQEDGSSAVEDACEESFPFLKTAWKENYIEYEGNETYAIIPQSNEWKLKVYELIYNDSTSGEQGRCLYESQDGKAVILRCNMSDIYSNVVVTVSKAVVTEPKGDKVFSWMPSISLKDKAVLAGTDWIYDFSLYEEAN